MSNFIEELKARRSQYVLTSESPVGDQEIVKTVEDVTVRVPSAFNSQPQRAVVLFGDANQKLWNIVKETLRKVVSDDEAFKATEAKINAFAAGHGTVLFYDDTDVTKQLQKNFPTYAANFPGFARDAAGMLQLAVWTALAEKGLGASLQHYNPLIDEAVAAEFGLPRWTVIVWGITGVSAAIVSLLRPIRLSRSDSARR